MTLAIDQLDPPLVSERDWIRRRLPGVPPTAAFLDVRMTGVPGTVRLLEWDVATPAIGHHGRTVRYGRAAWLHVGSGLVTVVSGDTASPDFSWSSPAHASVAAQHRDTFDEFLRSMIGLDGTTAAWHATATCPSGTAPVTDGLQIVRGWRQVVRCRSVDGAVDVEVRESRVPVVVIEAARCEADLASQIQPWASAPNDGALARSMRVVMIGGREVFLGSLAWPVMRDMGRDNRPVRARMVQAVIATASGNVQIGWLARERHADQAESLVRAYLASVSP
jgi:hypothetical protein